MSASRATGWRPEWVITGVDLGAEGVAVYGCKDVYHGTLEFECEYDLGPLSSAGFFDKIPALDRTTVRLSTEGRTYTVAYGRDYAEALRRLLEGWTPEPASEPVTPALPFGRPQLGGGE